MADYVSEAEVADAEILTSYSNPNYTLIIESTRSAGRAAQHSAGGHDSNGNVAVAGDDNKLSNKAMDDSGDSAISSPTTDSALASPIIDDVDAAGQQQNGAGSRYDGLCAKMQRAVQLHQLDEMEYCESVSNSKPPAGSDEGEKQGDAFLSTTKDIVSSNGSDDSLPLGWQRHEDKDGPYYWHIKSGTIQREVPIASPSEQLAQKELQSADCKVNAVASTGTNGTTMTAQDESKRPSDQSTLKEDRDDRASREYEVLAPDVTKYPIRFAVRSLGWVPIAEDQLTQESSSRAVNQCIIKLSSGLRDVNDVVGRWGDGKYLYMDLDQENLSLVDPHDLTVLNVQPIRAIRVWGVGRDSGRDFAYVARDRVTRQHMCHVFRCELPARHIANTLCEICKKIIAQRAAAAQAQAAQNTNATASNAVSHRTRPTDLPVTNVNRASNSQDFIEQTVKYENLLKNASFPTPMDEPKKTMSCHYLGTLPVPMATGVEVLNEAIDAVHSRVPAVNWTYAHVTIAPSTITITEHDIQDNVIAECRVRFLSFLGISLNNVKLCAFIMHTAQDQFIAHVFHCEPSAGALCKTIEAACKLRYQKCLDKSAVAAATDMLLSPTSLSGNSPSSSAANGKGLRANIKEGVQTVLSSFTKMRRPSKS